MKLDLHVHCSERSACGLATSHEMIRAARLHGLDGIALTDHDQLPPKRELNELRRQYAPFLILTGIEISLYENGKLEHLVVLGIHDEQLEHGAWQWADLRAFVQEQGGFSILAHPFRYDEELGIDVLAEPPDAMEIHSMNTGACDSEQIRVLARAAGCFTICNSDAHNPDNIGIYHSHLSDTVHSEADAIVLLKRGAYTCASRNSRIVEINTEVELREAMIQGMIDDGMSKADFIRETGHWGGYWDRVAMGRSYSI